MNHSRIDVLCYEHSSSRKRTMIFNYLREHLSISDLISGLFRDFIFSDPCLISSQCDKSEHYKRDCRFKKKLKKKQINVINMRYERIMTRDCWLCEKIAEKHQVNCLETKDVETTAAIYSYCDICDDDLKQHNEECYRVKIEWISSTKSNDESIKELITQRIKKQEHNSLHWTECYDDDCLVHYQRKKFEYFFKKSRSHAEKILTKKVIECNDFEDYEEYETYDDEEQDFVKIDLKTNDAAQELRNTTNELVRKREVHEIIKSTKLKDENIFHEKKNKNSKN